MSNPLLAQLRAYAPTARRSTIVTLQLLTAFHLLTTDIAEVRLCSGFSMLPTLSHQGDFVLISPLPLKFYESGLQRAARGGGQADEAGGGGVLGWFRARHDDERGELVSDSDTTWGIKRGDIIIATSPTDPSKTVCKRVIGLEGDIIQIDPTRNSTRRHHRPKETPPTWEQIDAQHREAVKARRKAEKDDETQTADGTILVPVFPSAPPATPHRPRASTDHVRIPRGHVWLAGDNLSNSTDSRAYGPVPMALLKGKVLARVGPAVHSWRSADSVD